MNLIERYIFRRVLLLTVATLLVTTAIAMITQVLIHVNLMSSTGQSLMTFLRLAGLLIPSMLVVVTPFALMLGASQTLSTMNGDSELPVIEASGGSRMLTAKPILILAMLMSLASLATSLYAEPWANRNLRNLLVEARTDLLSVAVQSGIFHKLQNNLYVHVADKLAGGSLGGIFLSDERDPATELVYYAKYGAFIESEGKNFLVMSDGELHRKIKADGNVSVIKFATYAFDLSLIGDSQSSAAFYYPKEQTTAYLFNPDPNDAIYQRRPQNYYSEINRRFSEWLYPVLFALITIYFLGKAHSHRSEQIWSMIFAAAIGFFLRGLGYFVTDKSGREVIYMILCYAIPAGGIVAFGSLILTNITFRTPQFLIDGATSLAAFAMRTARPLLLRFRLIDSYGGRRAS
ncbi:LPS export ABC transporter permease LptF [Hoeflea sp. CAU 1731]